MQKMFFIKNGNEYLVKGEFCGVAYDGNGAPYKFPQRAADFILAAFPSMFTAVPVEDKSSEKEATQTSVAKGQIYQHAKGGIYEIVALARNSNDCKQELVVYKSREESDFPAGTVWVRTLTEFTTQGRFILKEGAQE